MRDHEYLREISTKANQISTTFYAILDYVQMSFFKKIISPFSRTFINPNNNSNNVLELVLNEN